MQFPVGEPGSALLQPPQKAATAVQKQGFHLPSVGQLIISTIGMSIFILGFFLLMLAALVTLVGMRDIFQSASLFALAMDYRCGSCFEPALGGLCHFTPYGQTDTI